MAADMTIHSGKEYRPEHSGLLNGRLTQTPTASPTEHTYWDPGEKGFYTQGGFYEHDEYQGIADVAKRGAKTLLNTYGGLTGDSHIDHARDYRKFSAPLQGQLFGPHVAPSAENESKEAKRMAAQTSNFDHEGFFPSQRIVDHIADSRMPTELIKATGGVTRDDRHIQFQLDKHQAGGLYMSGTDSVLLRPQATGHTVVHELGHRADWRAGGTAGTNIVDSSRTMPNGRNYAPDPRAEGVADGFADRYGRTRPPRSTEFFNNNGYTPGYFDYSQYGNSHPYDRAVYVATRAHVGATGEMPPSPTGAASAHVHSQEHIDEYLHKMLNTSPVARRALREHGLDQWGRGSEYRYKESRRVGTQLSMQFEGVGVEPVYDIPDDHKPPKETP